MLYASVLFIIGIFLVFLSQTGKPQIKAGDRVKAVNSEIYITGYVFEVLNSSASRRLNLGNTPHAVVISNNATHYIKVGDLQLL